MSDPGTDDEPRLLADRYQLGWLIAPGGQGKVYRGHDVRLDRAVAIKLLHQPAMYGVVPGSPESQEVADDAERARQRFIREIRTMARLGLVGVPAVYDTGVDEQTRQLFLVMELLDGATLRDLLSAQDFTTAPRSVEWAAAIGTQIAATLVEVHRADVVHRDIKPENVVVTTAGLVKVLDFGVAILQGAGALPRLTQVAQTVGTPPYMSPEQCVNNFVGPPSDIYGLGCLMYELLTGRVPFRDTPRHSLLYLHQHVEAAPVGEIRDSVPQDITRLVQSMLAKEPDARPSADEVYEALLQHAFPPPGVSVSGQRDPLRPFTKPFAPAPASRPASAPTVPSDLPLTFEEADALKEQADRLVRAQQPQQAVAVLEAAIKRAGDAEIANEVRLALAGVLFVADEFTQAAQTFEIVRAELIRLYGEKDPDVVKTSRYAGLAYAELGRHEQALPHLQYFLSRQVPGNNEEAVRQVRFAYGRMLAESGLIVAALREYDSLRAECADVYGIDSAHVAGLEQQIEKLQKRDQLRRTRG